MNRSAVICLFGLISTTACAMRPPEVAHTPVGNLIVYSATYAPTLEQGEYPAHTDYTIATPDGKVIQHVKNATGSYGSRPAIVSLSPGQYHVRAQYDRGGFVVTPVVIEPGKTTVLDLKGEPLPQGSHGAEEVRFPDGTVVGWRAMID
jgi:hypothetical protein